ncbi:MAG: hypothetical protein KDA97_01560, partial [Acidimicrobiales bacterium]|nr:hypothetical protein [Acidimicrobiales bacterium]
LVSLLILPAILKMYDSDKLIEWKQSPDPSAIVIAVVAAIVVAVAIWYAKSAGEKAAAEVEAEVAA